MAMPPSTSIYSSRQKGLIQALEHTGLSAMVLNPGPSLTYLTGLHFHLMERPVVALFTPSTPVTLVLPELELGKTNNLPYPVQCFSYQDNPATWKDAFSKAAQAVKITGQQVGVEPNRLRVLELRFLEEAAPSSQFLSAEEVIASLRLQKDADEILSIRNAVCIAQEALQATLPIIKIGMSERELAAELTLQLLRSGSDPELSFSPIVASGPNSANPHAVPSNRQLTYGDLLVLDWGACYQGYISDLTRTFAVGSIDPEMANIYHVVFEANLAGRSVASPKIPAGEVDLAARSVIDKAGYGKYFTHRTGHGIGMEGHEEPYIYAENSLRLAPGMVFTVEPGIYLPGRGGVRIEDNVVITSGGAESLSDFSRELITITE
jgi:Xaa-Pro dipeptidase